MTKPTGVGRGGSRPGAGRPRKVAAKRARNERKPALVVASKATVLSVEALARSFTAEAIQALADIAINGEKEQARVAAANALLDRGHGRPSAKQSDDGKPSPSPAEPGGGWDALLAPDARAH